MKSHASAVPARHLDFEHPQVQAVRTFVAQCAESHNVCERLVANFDQVWTTTYRHQSKVLHKSVEKLGQHKVEYKPSEKKMMDAIRKALNVADPGADLEDENEPIGYQPSPPVLNAPAQISPVENWRFPRTTTTLSWSDGELGGSWVTIREGSAPNEVVKKINADLEGVLEVHVQDSKSHMWSSSTMLAYLEYLSVQLRMKRLKHNLSLKDGRALIICDKAAVHGCKTFESLRRRWEIDNHAIIVHGGTSDTVRVPPGFGAVGAPNDGWHQFFHLLRQSYQKVVCKQGRYLTIRAALDELDLAVDGSVRFTKLGKFKNVLLIVYIYIYT